VGEHRNRDTMPTSCASLEREPDGDAVEQAGECTERRGKGPRRRVAVEQQNSVQYQVGQEAERGDARMNAGL